MSPIPKNEFNDTNCMNQSKISTKTCRICYISDSKFGNELICPCNCSGSNKYIHRNCLDKWRKKYYQKENYYRCEVCLKKYKIGYLANEELVSFIRFCYFNIGKFNPYYFFLSQIPPLIFSISTLLFCNLKSWYTIDSKSIHLSLILISFGNYLSSIVYLLVSLFIIIIMYLSITNQTNQTSNLMEYSGFNTHHSQVSSLNPNKKFDIFSWRDSNELSILNIITALFLNLFIGLLTYDFFIKTGSFLSVDRLIVLIFQVLLNNSMPGIIINYLAENIFRESIYFISKNYDSSKNKYVGYLFPVEESNPLIINDQFDVTFYNLHDY